MSVTEMEKTCRRCGECCRKGGPALHEQDTECFGEADGISLEHLTTIRAGELVFDQPVNAIGPLEQEIVKIRGAANSRSCFFYQADRNRCFIYKRRPSECRALQCDKPEELRTMYDSNRLNRRDLLPEGHPLLELMDEHDQRCAPDELGRLAQVVLKSTDREAMEVIGSMLTYDREIRTLVAEKSGLPAQTMDFLFGRPLPQVLKGFGLRVERTADGIRLIKTPFNR